MKNVKEKLTLFDYSSEVVSVHFKGVCYTDGWHGPLRDTSEEAYKDLRGHIQEDDDKTHNGDVHRYIEDRLVKNTGKK